MNDRLPLEGVFPMHCSANVAEDGRVAVFFGLSGTGKTTLSADPERALIGDDEHGWGDAGVFNIEGGCYAKVIRLSAEAEPEIFATTHTYGTILENVVLDENGVLDLDDDSKTENTRAAYKLEQIANALPAKQAGHPSTVIFLTADAFGILPPIARLSREQALYYFLSGFTAKLAGTEIGVTEPQPTFSTCFGQPFLPQPPGVYANLLGSKLDRHGATVWLVNTGWTGGPFGEGSRMPIQATRTMLRAALSGDLDDAELRTRPQLSASASRSPSPGSTRSSSIRVRRGGNPSCTTGRRVSWQRCSPRTSRRGSVTSTKRFARPARSPDGRSSLARRDHHRAADRRADVQRDDPTLRTRAGGGDHAAPSRAQRAADAVCGGARGRRPARARHPLRGDQSTH